MPQPAPPPKTQEKRKTHNVSRREIYVSNANSCLFQTWGSNSCTLLPLSYQGLEARLSLSGSGVDSPGPFFFFFLMIAARSGISRTYL